MYTIVTNDKYELPIVCDILGLQAVADYLGMSKTTLHRRIKKEAFDGDYKVIDMGWWHGEERNETIAPLSEEERKKKLCETRRQRHHKSIEKTKRYQMEYYLKNRLKILAAAKENYLCKRQKGNKDES